MLVTPTDQVPGSGWKGSLRFWKNDLAASLSVLLVALPLALGIAIASGAPPVAGLISVVVGGLVTTFVRGSHLGINAPSKALIVVALVASERLGDGAASGLPYVMAAFAVSGVIHVMLGVLRLGKLGHVVPSAVIYGVLAAIGLIIIGTQVHVALGVASDAHQPLAILLDIPRSVLSLNPLVTLTSAVALLILIGYPKVRNPYVRYLPAPMWVLLITVPLFAALQWGALRAELSELVNADCLVQIPQNLTEGLVFPDFSKIDQPIFWLMVVLITLLLSLESLVSAKAADRLDPYRRKTNLNDDLIGVGLGTVVSAMLGGLPVSTAIVCSSVNINSAAKTRWSNFFLGGVVLIFVLGFRPLLQMIPMAALAVILIFTGYKLVSPSVFKSAYHQGWEQICILVVTLVAALIIGLVPGLLIGIVFTLLVHYLRSGLSFALFVQYLRQLSVKVVQERRSTYLFKLKGVVNFFNMLQLQRKIYDLGEDKHIILDFSHARIVDLTVLEYIHEYAEKYSQQGGEFHFTGLDTHETSSHHPHALHVLRVPEPLKVRLTRRQVALKQLAHAQQWHYDPNIHWDVSKLDRFLFFKTHPVDFTKNQLTGRYPDSAVRWEICDITLKNAFITFETHRLTVEILSLPYQVPVFSLEEESFLNRMSLLVAQQDIDFEEHKQFSRKFLLQGPDESSIRRFFSPTLVRFFEQGDIYHLESNGRQILIFRNLRLISAQEVATMVGYSEKLVSKLHTARAQLVE
jgi:MFS superfamily sulfate permease-like transporter